jgi:hypothetical protein
MERGVPVVAFESMFCLEAGEESRHPARVIVEARKDNMCLKPFGPVVIFGEQSVRIY